MIVGVVLVGIALLLAGVGFSVVGMNMRPPGAPLRYGGRFGFFENSTRSGKIVGLIGLMVFIAGLKVLIP